MRKKARRDHVLHKLVDFAELHIRGLCAMSPNGPLSFTRDDIAEFVRCKAAAFTMVQTLMEAAGVSLDEVGTFYLSGGFGTHLDLESAVTIGMYPDIPREKFKILGNSSLGGVKKLLLDEAQLARG